LLFEQEIATLGMIGGLMRAVETLKQHFEPGMTYRRADVARWSKAVDRHLKMLVADGTLTKLAGGLYYRPRPTSFGAAPARDEDLVASFLKDRRFLLTSPNSYNSLGLGSTQLYNETVVYNHKRHGRFKLGKRTFDFRVKPHFPNKMTQAFLLVDMVNNHARLAEDPEMLLANIKRRAQMMDREELAEAVRSYGGLKAKKFFQPVLREDTLTYAR
jgi:hypothetical protein